MGTHAGLAGRSAELAALQLLLDDVMDGRGRGVTLCGVPGIGKSALLSHLEELSPQTVMVLRARGIPGEAEIAFSGLSDLVGPLTSLLGMLPPVQAEALSGALAIGPAGAGDRLAVCVATLGLLRLAARQAPVLALVDDAQWLDSPSLECVRYAARRTSGRLAFAVAERPPESGADTGEDEWSREGMLVVPPLDLADSLDVLTAVAPDLTAGVSRVLARAADGNPLALTELPATLTASQRTGSAALPSPIVPGRRLQAVFSAQVEELSSQTQRALLICALHQGEGVAGPAAAFRCVDLDLSALAEAEATGLVQFDEHELRFSHPLLRGAVVSVATPGQRRQAHRTLAEVLEGDRRVWHLAAATVGPDAGVADALERSALDAVGRRGYASASRGFQRAARLSTSDALAVRRLLHAARAAVGAGQPKWALTLLDEAASHHAGKPTGTGTEHLRGVCLLWTGRVREAAGLLTAEAERLLVSDPALASVVFADAATARAATTEYVLAEALAERAAQQAVGVDDLTRAHVLAVLGWVLTLRGRTAQALKVLDEADQLSSNVDPLSPGNQWMSFLLRSHVPTGRLHRALEDSTALSTRARDAGALATLAGALVVTSDAALRLGEWTAADEATQEALAVCRDAGQEIWRGYALAYRARLLAARGLEHDSEAAARAAIRLAETTGVRAGLRFAYGALGFLWLSMERISEAISELEAVDRLLAGTGIEDCSGVPWAPDLVEAYARAGQAVQAARILDALDGQETHGPATSRGLIARCRGVLASDFDEDFAVALACDDECPMPFERSRTLLAYGRRLRRAGRRVQARVVLGDAVIGFARLGAAPWREQAEGELRSAGQHVVPTAAAAGQAQHATILMASLTPQEQRVAAAVARGASNREIATMLFVSPKTVEAHLTHLHRKLRVGSRSELVALLARSVF